MAFNCGYSKCSKGMSQLTKPVIIHSKKNGTVKCCDHNCSSKWYGEHPEETEPDRSFSQHEDFHKIARL